MGSNRLRLRGGSATQTWQMSTSNLVHAKAILFDAALTVILLAMVCYNVVACARRCARWRRQLARTAHVAVAGSVSCLGDIVRGVGAWLLRAWLACCAKRQSDAAAQPAPQRRPPPRAMPASGAVGAHRRHGEAAGGLAHAAARGSERPAPQPYSDPASPPLPPTPPPSPPPLPSPPAAPPPRVEAVPITPPAAPEPAATEEQRCLDCTKAQGIYLPCGHIGACACTACERLMRRKRRDGVASAERPPCPVCRTPPERVRIIK